MDKSSLNRAWNHLVHLYQEQQQGKSCRRSETMWTNLRPLLVPAMACGLVAVLAVMAVPASRDESPPKPPIQLPDDKNKWNVEAWTVVRNQAASQDETQTAQVAASHLTALQELERLAPRLEAEPKNEALLDELLGHARTINDTELVGVLAQRKSSLKSGTLQ